MKPVRCQDHNKSIQHHCSITVTTVDWLTGFPTGQVQIWLLQQRRDEYVENTPMTRWIAPW